jgi:purine-nucleoside phosphorylase
MSNPKAEAIARYAAAVTMADALRAASGGVKPRALVILGSGLGHVVDEMRVVSQIAFADIPGFPPPTVEGHAGRFEFGYADETPVLIMRGRIHLYEGHPVELLAVYVRAARLLGADTLVVTNAAGGINPQCEPGHIMLIEDHINLTFTNPLLGPNVDEFGPRFPGMCDIYTAELRELARAVALERGIDIREGVYVGLAGPSFETMAEVRMLRTLGADVVGMSTVNEAIVAAHAGMRVLGFSLVTNVAGCGDLRHEMVLEASRAAAPRLAQLVAGILSRL